VDKQYAFFSKDTIDWGNYSYAGFYKTLFDLKHRNQALWNGDAGGDLIKIPTTKDEDVYAFTREKNGDKVVVVINLSAEQQNINLNSSRVKGIYTDVFTEQSRQLQEGQSMLLQPWQYKVFSNK
jgi:glycosidase